MNYRKYQFEWRDSTTNALISNFSVDTVGKFRTTISNLSDGVYSFKAWDAGYGIAPLFNESGCFVQIFVRVVRPLPLEVTVNVEQNAKCFGDSVARLKAIPSGGVPISLDSTKYNFEWYRKVNGTFALQQNIDSFFQQLPAGEYYVKVKDRFLNESQSSIINIQYPSPLSITATATPASCFLTKDGSASAVATGGTAPYRYEWSTGQFGANVSQLGGGNYVVVVTDTNLCTAAFPISVSSPNRISTTVSKSEVSCFDGANGAASLSATGGAGGYTYLWSNGATTSSVANLSSGSYWYRITDVNGCFDTDTLEFDNPDFYAISTVDSARKICVGQEIFLRASIVGNSSGMVPIWNGPGAANISANQITTSTPGTYIVQAVNNRGCVQKDTVFVASSTDSVNTSFTVSTQAFAGENTTLVNISPAAQDSAKWLLPNLPGILRISESKHFCEARFVDTGSYTVGIRAFYSNGCIDEKYKAVNVVQRQQFTGLGAQAEAFLKEFSLYPNPANSNFTVAILFNSVTPARIRVINILTNGIMTDRSIQGAASYTEVFQVGSYPAGTYIVLIETAKGNFVHKLNKF